MARWDASGWEDKMNIGPHYLGDGGMFVVVAKYYAMNFTGGCFIVDNELSFTYTLFLSNCAFLYI